MPNSLATRTVNVYSSNNFEPDCCLRRFTMLKDTVIDFAINWSGFLCAPTPDTITTSTWTVELRNNVGTNNMVATSDSISGDSDLAVIFLDTNNTEETQIYSIKNAITTAKGRTIFACFEVQILECDC